MPPKPTKSEYIETDTGNKVSRLSKIHGTQNIILGGRTVIQSDVVIRGDLVRSLPSTSTSSQPAPHPHPNPTNPPSSQTPSTISISIGRYTFISSHSTLRPPSRLHRGTFSHHPLKIGDNVYIGPGCVVEAASIGNNVEVGEGCVLGNMAIVKDGVRVLRGTVVPEGAVLGPGVVVGGRPGRVLGEVGVGWEGVDGRGLWRGVG